MELHFGGSSSAKWLIQIKSRCKKSPSPSEAFQIPIYFIFPLPLSRCAVRPLLAFSSAPLSDLAVPGHSGPSLFHGVHDGQCERRSSTGGELGLIILKIFYNLNDSVIALSSSASDLHLCTASSEPLSFPPFLSNIFFPLVFPQTFLSHLSSPTQKVGCALLFLTQILLCCVITWSSWLLPCPKLILWAS